MNKTHIKILKIICIILIVILLSLLIWCLLPNKDCTKTIAWPSNVIIISPSDDIGKTQTILDGIFNLMGGKIPEFNGQFSDKRFAIMFKPGTYPLNITIGYYTSIIGLGQKPEDVIITGSVNILDGSDEIEKGGLDNFWRSCENITIKPSPKPGGNITQFSVSQACPLRKLNIMGNVFLFTQPKSGAAAYTSGGYLSDSKISGTIFNGSQQQFFTRNTQFKEWSGSVWNQVFAGCNHTPEGVCPPCPADKPINPPKDCHYDDQGKVVDFLAYTNIGTVEKIAEKPYLIYDKDYYLFIPMLEKDKIGPTIDYSNGKKVPFSSVFIALDTDSAQTINNQIKNGKHIILTPGIYNLEDSIIIDREDTVILGMGMPTLVTTNSNPCIIVKNVEGVRISGLIVQATNQHSNTLFQWGDKGDQGNQENPGIIQDVFGRVGGPDKVPVSTGSMMEINQDNVIIDNIWLWVADHGNKVGYGINKCDYGLVVNGDNVTAYGLMSEHNDKYNVLWNGNGGKVYFYQSEFRYDFPDQKSIKSDDNDGTIVSYRVADKVTSHEGHGLGAYCFNQKEITFDSGFKVPNNSGIDMRNLVTVLLKGKGGITHVINDMGEPVKENKDNTTEISYYCKYPPSS
jgi:hypothetical protein